MARKTQIKKFQLPDQPKPGGQLNEAQKGLIELLAKQYVERLTSQKVNFTNRG